MAHKATYNVLFKRRREGKTNYAKRLNLLKSAQTRIVVRKSNARIRIQAVAYEKSGDRTIVSAQSGQLQSFGWSGSMCNIPSAYLTGFLFGQQAVAAGVSSAVLDIGIHTAMKGGRLFAAVKGIRDAGVQLPSGDEAFPKQERLSGGHITAYAKALSEADRQKQFSGVLKGGFDPQQVKETFEKVRSAIAAQAGQVKTQGQSK